MIDTILQTINWILITIGIVSLLYIFWKDDSKRDHFLGWQYDEQGNTKELKKGWVKRWIAKLLD